MDNMKRMPEKQKKSDELIRVGEDSYVPEKYIDEDGDLLVYDGFGCWIAKNEQGEVVKKVRV